jgi:hypothetical protein
MPLKIMENIVDSSIKYAAAANNPKFHVDVDELMVFIAVCLSIGLKGYRGNRRDLWGTHALEKFEFIKEIMGRTRFEEIWRYFHLQEGPKRKFDEPDPYYKVSWLMDHLNKIFLESWKPSQVKLPYYLY